ncbi:GMC family oxidoreductase N-terminal domain-containing protein [Streptacidiphilus fuscans]|uniref:Cholesterol oxidase n=1 Tax=Streptacidiphilus fuscans TaxID=2789292 RepID=A0A931AYG4_9ACTN|nr:GMC family oxidoreductase [Streptacidiphilus fuscans]MBF9067855.1 GMC family oxidoreductase [Streptacidiphilus fuscans]
MSSEVQADGAPEQPVADQGYDYDVVIVGSGFGGSVSALRLTEKGYKVAVLEAGRRFTPETLPKTSWDTKNYIWAPALGLYGIQRFHVLDDVMVLGGSGVGGGSLNYANTLYVPPKPFFQDPQWKDITDWSDELAPYYDQAQRMLGVRKNPTVTPSDVHLRDAAEKLGYGDTFHMAPVGVFFGDGQDCGGAGAKVQPGDSVEDPYFGGAGPRRKACTECGECMTGCRHGAKNTLTENYLYLAEKNGAEIIPMTTVTAIRVDGEGYAVDTRRTDSRSKNPARNGFRSIRAQKVVVSAGTYGTQKLLHRLRDEGVLPQISASLGRLTRTNSEALVGAMTTDKRYGKRVDFTKGVAITSSVHPDEHTHIEPVRYGKGSNAMSLMTTIQVPGEGRAPRLLRAVGLSLKRPDLVVRAMNKRRWSERTIIGLVMQSLDNSINVTRRKSGPLKGQLSSGQGHGAPNPKFIPAAEQAAGAIASEIGGFPGTNVGDLMGRTLTAHFLGGCVIGDSPEHGVVDPYQRLYGYPGITVADGSTVSANLGVNPSLTITAQTERAMALWPNKGDADPRPAQDEAYRRVEPVAPQRPAVPESAFGALRLPLLAVPQVPPRKAE